MNSYDNGRGYVYIVQCDEVFKIGVSTLPEQRINIIKTDNYKPIVVHGFWKVEDPYGVEAFFHEEYGGVRVRGEWFMLNKNDVILAKNILNELSE